MIGTNQFCAGLVFTALLAASTSALAQWSVLDSDPRPRDPAHFYHAFSTEQWNRYERAPEESVRAFRDVRYGLFIHFGLSSFGPGELSWSRATHVFPDGGSGTIPDEKYNGFAKEFRLERFDADEWVGMAIRAGMKYIVVVAKHHDGFHMWDTAHSDFKITNSPFGRDYLKELARASRKAGLLFGVYYSQRDWYHPDYEPVDKAIAEPLAQPPFWRLRPGASWRAGSRHANYVRYMHDTVRELATGYGKIDMFWWDALWYGGTYRADMWGSELIEREVRRLQPGILINNRAGLPGDFDTPEQRLGMFQDHRPWESCVSLGPLWAWSPGNVKSKAEIIRLLVGTAVGDGNLLLSTGARPDGSFDPEQVRRLLEVGDWLREYGHTIYGTRGGPWKPDDWGGTTRRGDTSYIHVTSWPDGDLVLPVDGRGVPRARLLTGNGEVSVTLGEEELRIAVRVPDRDPIDTIIELDFGASKR